MREREREGAKERQRGREAENMIYVHTLAYNMRVWLYV